MLFLLYHIKPDTKLSGLQTTISHPKYKGLLMEQIYKIGKNGVFIRGIGLPAFIHNGDYYVVLIKIYEDGTIECWRECNFKEFLVEIKNGWVVTQLPKDAKIDMFQLFYADTNSLKTFIKEREFIKHVKDIMRELQNRPTSKERCIKAFLNYLEIPDERHRQILQNRYIAVAKHLRDAILGDMGGGDGAIKEIILGNMTDKNLISVKKYYSYLREDNNENKSL